MSKGMFHNLWMAFKRIALAMALMLLANGAFAQAQKPEATEQLGKALEYFSAGKYHEALLLFEKLNEQYQLNSRFKAYLGVCHYYEWNYEEACKYLDEVTPEMEVYSPHEQNVYYHAAGESHFNIQEYDKAIPFYEKQLYVCYDNEKADALYKIGFCYMFKEDWQNAYDSLSSALSYYKRFRNSPDTAARIRQIGKMLKGIKRKL